MSVSQPCWGGYTKSAYLSDIGLPGGRWQWLNTRPVVEPQRLPPPPGPGNTSDPSPQVLGCGHRRVITLTPRAQQRRFTSDLLRVLKAQLSRQLAVSALPEAFGQVLGGEFSVWDYGATRLQTLLSTVNGGLWLDIGRPFLPEMSMHRLQLTQKPGFQN